VASVKSEDSNWTVDTDKRDDDPDGTTVDTV